MASTTSQIDTGLDAISEKIASEHLAVEKIVANAAQVSQRLAAIATDNSALIADIQNLPANDAYNDTVQSRLAKLVTEFQALKGVSDTIAGQSV